MKLKYILLPFIATAFTISSCSDFLDRKPLTDNVDDGFFTEPIQLQAYCNKKYELLPDYKDINLFTEDQKAIIKQVTIRKIYSFHSESKWQAMEVITDKNIYATVTTSYIILLKM